MNHKLIKLSNGLRVLTVPLPNLKSVTITVWAKVGSRNESKKVGGISHFLEHMVFKGSKKRPSAKEIAEAVDAIGGEFNAATSKQWTNFYIKARVEVLEKAFDVLSDMVLAPLLKKEDIEREKGVIIEEMAMYEDTPMMKISDVFDQLIFKGSPLGCDIIGTKESVKNITRNDFERYRKIHYYSENMLITIAGGIKEGNVLNLAKKYFGGLKKGGEKERQEFKSIQKGAQIKLHPKKKEQAHFILGFLGNPMDSKDRFVESVLAGLLGQGMSSRLFSEVREKRGLAYAIRTSVDHYVDIGYIGTYAGVDVKRVNEAVKVTLDQHYGLASGLYKISEVELSKAKEYIKGRLTLSLENTNNVNFFFGVKELILGKTETPEEVLAGIDKVTKADLVKLAKKLFIPERLNLAIIGPYKSQARFENLLK